MNHSLRYCASRCVALVTLLFLSVPMHAQDGATPALKEGLRENYTQRDFEEFLRKERNGELPSQAGRVVSHGISDVLVNNNTGSTGTSNFTQSETDILAFGSNVIVGFNDSGSFTGGASKFTGWSYSTDGGATFTDGGALPTNTGGDAGDPVLARNETTGRIYYSTLQFTGDGIRVFRSDDNAVSWMAPVQGAPGKTGFQDKQWIAVDNFPGSGNGNVYLVVRDFGSGNGIYFFKSTDNGDNFGPSGGTLIAAGGAVNVQGAFVAVGTDHSVNAFYFDESSVPERIMMRRSTDFGATFGASVVVTTLGTSTGFNGDLGLTGTRQGTASASGFRSNAFPHVAINPVSGNIYVTYNDNPAGTDKADVFFRQSTDAGATWSAAVLVNDDGTTTDQWQPTIAVTPDGANLGIFYYSREEDAANNLFKYYGRTGAISGSSVVFDPSFAVSDVASLPEFGRDGVVNSSYMGDYNHAAATATAFHVVWSDNRDNLAGGGDRKDPNVYYRNIPLAPPPAVSDAPTVDSPIPSGSTSVTGTSTEADGTFIDVFVNSSHAGTTTVSSGTWTKGGLLSVGVGLVVGDTVKATATATGETTSPFSNEVVVQNVSAAPVVDSPIASGAASVSGTSTEADGTIIEVFVNSFSNGTTTVSGGAWTKGGLVASIAKSSVGLVAGDTVKATATATGEITSSFSNGVIVQDVTAAPVVNSPITAGATSVSGTGPESIILIDGKTTKKALGGTLIIVYVNSDSVGAVGVDAGGTWTRSGLAPLAAGDTVKATATAIDKLVSPFSNEVIVGVGDNTLPTASLTSAPDVLASGGTSYSLTVTFADNNAIDVSTLDNSDIRVTGPGGSFDVLADFVSVDVNTDGTPRVATYSFTPPGGTWNSGDDGTYTISMEAGQVADLAANTVAAGSLGTFEVFPHKFIVTNTNDSGEGSLRQAIENVNSVPNVDASTPDTIHFAIPGSGPHTITPSLNLPTVTHPTIIDGYTQPGASKNTLAVGNNAVLKIVISGNPVSGQQSPDAGGSNGLLIAGGKTTVQGLVINDFDIGILVGSGLNSILGNFIGTNAAGTTAISNNYGVAMFAGGGANVIGGTAPSDRNLISGNASFGIHVNGSNGNSIMGNYIGTNAAGTSPLPNSTGIIFISASDNTVGGLAANSGNIIAHSTNRGVYIHSGVRNAVDPNSIFGNGTLGIDLDVIGVTPNDATDGDGGPNNLQNFPEFSSATRESNGDVTLQYVVTSDVANSSYPLHIEFFKADGGQGRTFIGSNSYTALESELPKTVTFTPEVAMNTGDQIVATATDADGNTSEFSAVVVISGPVVSNVIANGDFESGTSPWVFFTNGTGSYIVVAPGASGSGNAARLTNTTSGSNTQFYQSGITLAPGTQYTLTFKARSTASHDLSVFVHRHDSPYTNYGLNGEVFNLTNVWQTFTTTFTAINFPPPTPSNARLRFRLNGYAAAGEQYFIDDVELVATGSVLVATKINVETAPDGGGSIVPAQTIENGDIVTMYAISRTASNEFVANVSATWALLNPTGGVLPADLAPSVDGKSAVFTGGADGTTQVQATSGGLTPTPSNMITVFTPPPPTNLLVNGGFESGTSSWNFNTNGAGSFTAITPGNVGAKAGQISITTQGTSVQLYQFGISLTAGNSYRLSFKAFSTTGHDVQASVFKHASPFTPYGLTSHVFNLTNAWASYTVDFVASGFAGTVNDARLRFWLAPYDFAGDVYQFDDVKLELLPTPSTVRPSIVVNDVPTTFSLAQNFPNPFNPSTTIIYTLPVDARVTLEVVDMLGQRVAKLVDGNLSAGYHDAVFDASAHASGMYLYRLKAIGADGTMFTKTEKMLLTK